MAYGVRTKTLHLTCKLVIHQKNRLTQAQEKCQEVSEISSMCTRTDLCNVMKFYTHIFLLVTRSPGIDETCVVKEAWLSERTKGWEAVAMEAKRLIANSSVVLMEVKRYYQKSKLTSIIGRVKKCVEKLHIQESGNSRPRQALVTENSSSTNTKERPHKAKADPANVLEGNSSSEEYFPINPEQRKEKAIREKRKGASLQDDDEESSSSDEPKAKQKRKSKDELQRNALEKHTSMCEAALSTMQKMNEVLSNLQQRM